jgi:hypothetical protein
MHAKELAYPFSAPLLILLSALNAASAELPMVTDVDAQPLIAQVQRLIEATDYLGAPFSDADKKALVALSEESSGKKAVTEIQRILDAYCIAGVNINPEMRVKVAQGPATPQLEEQGWRIFLVKVANESGTTAELKAVSPNAMSLFEPSRSPSDEFYRKQAKTTTSDRWLDLELYSKPPMKKKLSGLALEYAILQAFSRDSGKREAKISFNVGQGTQDIGFRNEMDVLFDCVPASDVILRVMDEHGKPTTASFVVRDKQGRVYPPTAKRLAPDFPFHHQVYRADGEKLRLPHGEFTVNYTRGPEYLEKKQTIKVGDTTAEPTFRLERWVDPAKMGWWSGDHHIHAAGCAHYVKPTEGVHAEDMIRHCVGEDLKIGANLTWGPCFDYQKQFFCGTIDKVSKYPYLLRYDIEVSGFGSHQSGHLVLLRLKEQMYPGGDSKHHWPTLGLNTLRWAKKQGAVCGPAHSGWGLALKGDTLPSFEVPPFDGIGANEYIVDVTHEVPGPDGKLVPAVDFISTVDTPYVWEVNVWYHTLNAGYRTRISGETDFPCIYGEKVGLGRSYVKIDGELSYDGWCEGIRLGRNYVSDGKSHLIDMKVGSVAVGEKGSELRLAKSGSITVTAKVAAYLNETPDSNLQKRPYESKPYWDIERARVSDTREVPLELVVNGFAVARKNIPADGKLRDVSFDAQIERSSWVALRILPSSHSNPVFVLVDGKPIRPSRRSVEWCLKGVDQCWSEKEKFIKASEMDDAKAAYAHAREAYKKRLAECEID